MTGARYLALVGGSPERRRAIAATAIATAGLDTAFQQGSTTILTSPDLPRAAIGEHGLVVGTVLTPGRVGSVANFSTGTCDTILGSHGQHLIDRYWGGYVAFLVPLHGAPCVIRAPFGWLPCLYVRSDDITAFASDLTLLSTTNMFTPRLSRDALAGHLLAADIRHETTMLSGLNELRGGDRLMVDRTQHADRLWSPWTFVDPGCAIDDLAEATRRLRDTTRYCVAARTQPGERQLLLLSGGLDSSIVAACLAEAGRSFAALTLVTDNPSGDERIFASRVTDAIGVDLLEDRFAIEDVDILHSAAREQSRPVARSFEQGMKAMIARAVQSSGAHAVIDGGGGDNVFCSMQSPAPLADCLLARKGYAAFWKNARDLAELTDASVWTVSRRGWQRARSGRPYQRQPDRSFLSDAALRQVAYALDHPWLISPAGTLPGRTAHVGLLVPAQGLAEDHDVGAAFASQSVLVSQPLIEICLRIPSWLWLDRGRNRAAARHAFGNALPAETTWRRSKGTPDSFLVKLLDANRPVIRGLLKDGMLADLGLLDVSATLAALDDPRPDQGHLFARLMQLVDAEVWARCWPS